MKVGDLVWYSYQPRWLALIIAAQPEMNAFIISVVGTGSEQTAWQGYLELVE